MVGRIAMLPSLHVFEGWILGHNRVHHAFTVRQGDDFVWHPVTPEQFAAWASWRSWSTASSGRGLGAGVYYIHQIWWKKMIVGKAPARWVKTIRRDRWSWSSASSSACWPSSRLIGVALGDSIAGRHLARRANGDAALRRLRLTIGAAVHVHHISPEIRWWKKAEWNKFRAQMEGTTVLRVPKGINFFLHWIMVHVPHHVDMRVPMYQLEEAAEAIEAAFPGTVIDKQLRLRDYVGQTRACKLYDFDEGSG